MSVVSDHRAFLHDYVERLHRAVATDNAIFDQILALGGSDLRSSDTEALAARVRTSAGDTKAAVWPMTAGILRGIEDGWFMSEIAEAAFQYQVALEKDDKKVVGVNVHTSTISHELEILRVSHEVETEQVRELTQRRATRDQAAVDAALDAMVEVSRTDANMIPAMMDAVRVEASLGEICDALRAE